MDTLLEKVKANLVLEHLADDEMLSQYIAAAAFPMRRVISISEGYYSENVSAPYLALRSPRK